jgi:hypothetical protein
MNSTSGTTAPRLQMIGSMMKAATSRFFSSLSTLPSA